MTTLKVSSTKLITMILFCIVGLAFLYSRLRFMDIPFDRDEGSYLYMGYCFINGHVPYIDFYEIKPPGIFLIYGLFHFIFGSSTFLLHLGILLTQLSIAWLIYNITLNIFSQQQQGILAVCVYLVFNLSPNFMAFAILSEHFFVLFVLLSMYFLLKPTNKMIIKNIFIAGIFFGMSAMIRQHAIFFTLPMLALIVYLAHKENNLWFKNLSYFVSGSLLIIIGLIGYVAIRGGFDEMIYWVFTHPSEKYITKVSWTQGQKYLLGYFNNLFIDRHYPMLIFFGLGLLFLIKNIILKKQRWENFIVLLFFIGAFMTVFPGNRFYGHYWLMLFPFFALVAGKFLEQLSSTAWYKYSSILAVYILFINQFYLNKDLYFNIKADRIYRNLYSDNPNYSLQKITDYLKRIIKKEDEIFVFGSEPQVYYETRKVFALPHVFISFLHMPSERALNDQKETMSYLNSHKPAFIVHLQNPISVGMKENSHQNLYQWIFSFENQNYEKIALADINDQNVATYYFGSEANKTPSSSNYIYLYKRKNNR